MGLWLYSDDGSGTQQSTDAFSNASLRSATSVNTGPLIRPSPECSSNFDLDFLFEYGVLSMVASALFVVLASLRLLALRNCKDAVTNNWLLKSSKLVSGRLIHWRKREDSQRNTG